MNIPLPVFLICVGSAVVIFLFGLLVGQVLPDIHQTETRNRRTAAAHWAAMLAGKEPR